MASRKTALDYSASMRRLMEDLLPKVPELSHIRLDNIALTITRSKVEEHGQFAKIIPMRYEGGSDIRIYKKRRYRLPPLVMDGKEILYVISFCLPKFQNMPYEQKLLTVLHELYHISPEFNGDIRRFPGKNYAHGPSRKWYNDQVQKLVDVYLASEPDPDAIAFLMPNAEEVFAEYGGMTADRVTIPKLVPLDPAKKRKAA